MSFSSNDLRQVNVFAEAPDSDLEKIAQNSVERSIEEGEFFFFQGDPAEYLYVLTSGQVKLVQSSPNGKQVNIRTIQPWDMFAALGAVRKDATYPASAQALQDSAALVIKSNFMSEMMQTRPYLAVGLTRLMTSLIQEIQARFRELATERVEQRIAHTLLRLASQMGKRIENGVASVEMEFSRQDLAEMTGTTLFTVSRTLSEWEKSGVIEAGRERIKIKDLSELMKIAEQSD
ncbi:MAG TPA: Crp/Fnr family transcriptional regulator [Anaerolineales bacterium]|jgi:CRP-like cAMP-binding protein|nr:Crp/Fnr family transcriptional regulator [Anaerolineales bacterium]